MEMPKFNFTNPGITEEQFQEEEKFTPTTFEPGTYDLKIYHSTFMGMADKDPTWMKFRILIAPDGCSTTKEVTEDGRERYVVTGIDGKKSKSISEFIMVPTSSVLYNKGESKRPTAVFSKLRKFLTGISINITVTPESLSTLPNYFGKNDLLAGKAISCNIGYSKPYVKFEGGSTYVIVDKDGNKVVLADGENKFTSYDLALGAALINNIPVQKFIEILSYNVVESNDAVGEAPSDDWD